MSDPWQPSQYERYHDERARSFYDMLAMIRPVPGGRAVDLGCGTGELTVEVHERVGAAETVGIDNSDSMLTEAAGRARQGVRFERGDIGEFATGEDVGAFDVVASNAALHWVPDHRRVLAGWARALRPGGQLAVQVPSNADQPAHALAGVVAAEPEFAGLCGPDGPPPDPVLRVLEPEEYAVLLYDLGFEEQVVRLQVYPHLLPSAEDVVEWTKGSTLTRFKRVMAPDVYDRYVEAYRERVLAVFGDRRPCFFPFKRILLWARLPG